MNDILDLVFNYNRKLVEYNICNEKFDNLNKNIDYLMSNEETKQMAESMKSSVDIMNEKVNELNKEKEQLKHEFLSKVNTLSSEDKEKLLNTLESYSNMDETYTTIYEEVKE